MGNYIEENVPWLENIASATWFSLPGKQVLYSPSIWFMSRLHKSLFSLLPISEDAEILHVHVSAVALSTRIRDFGCSGCFSF